jgi:ssDNA-binding Zn-finger/Zn-ribbon topoisomerase 1
MAIDYWKLTKDFTAGDTVQKFMPGRSELTPYVGRVTAVLPGLGFIDVQWPFGNERVSPEELVRVNPDFQRYTPTYETFSYYAGQDAGPAAKLAAQEDGSPLWQEVAPGFHTALAQLYHKGASSIQAYDVLWHQYRQANDDAIRSEVQQFYRVAHNLMTAYLGEYATKTAAYWASKDRKYRATKPELESRKITCPKCKQAHMRKATYKMEDGVRAKLLACPNCMYLVKQSDVLGPGGSPVEW